MRGRAENDAVGNDSVWVQFSGSVTAAGAPVTRIGTTDSTWVGIEDCSGCGLSGWGWQDNAYGTGVLGPLVDFAVTGPQTIRIQQREDGISLDQIVLSPQLYLTVAPGPTKQDTLVLPLTAVAPPPAPAIAPVSTTEIVINAGAATTIAGTWRLIADTTAANGTSIGTVDAGRGEGRDCAGCAGRLRRVHVPGGGGPRHIGSGCGGERRTIRGPTIRRLVQFSGSLDARGTPWRASDRPRRYFVTLEDAVTPGSPAGAGRTTATAPASSVRWCEFDVDGPADDADPDTRGRLPHRSDRAVGGPYLTSAPGRAEKRHHHPSLTRFYGLVRRTLIW